MFMKGHLGKDLEEVVLKDLEVFSHNMLHQGWGKKHAAHQVKH